MAAPDEDRYDLDVAIDGLTLKLEDETHSVDFYSTPDEDELQSVTEDTDFYAEWGFPLDRLYRLGVQFYRENEGKAIHLSYSDKLHCVALMRQVTHGKYSSDTLPDVGALDVIGNDRRKQWQSLGDLSKPAAMSAFVCRLQQVCPTFRPWVEAHRCEEDELERIRIDDAQRRQQIVNEHKHQELLLEESQKQVEQDKLQQERHRLQIKQALNAQTSNQFEQYALARHPDEVDKQHTLIKELQDQHYQQYMQQIYLQQQIQQQQQLREHQQLQKRSDDELRGHHQQQQQHNNVDQLNNTEFPPMTAEQLSALANEDDESGVVGDDDENEGGAGGSDRRQSSDQEDDSPLIANASMWTRPQITEFKDLVRKDVESLIKVGRGETVTIRVPTHEDGTCLFWEFATDSYDVGFGLFFEWTIAQSNTVSVHISDESTDEDEEFDDDDTIEGSGDHDPERGRRGKVRPPTDEIIPVFRRDSHMEVYAGSHVYPGRGIYLLKFDNSYSLFRSKSLYYRVYYTR